MKTGIAARWILALLLLLPGGQALAREQVVVLKSDDLEIYDEVVQAFDDAWGGPVTVLSVEGDRARASELLRNLRFDPPPAVFALGARAAWSVRQELSAVPMVHGLVRNPGRYGLTGPMVTGVVAEMPVEAVLTQVQLFLPDARRLGVVLTFQNPQAGELRVAARSMGLDVKVAEVGGPGEVRGAVVRLARQVDVLLVLHDPGVLNPENFRFMREYSRRVGLPVVAVSDALARAGALLAVVPDYAQTGTMAAELVRRIVEEGAEPRNLAPAVPYGVRVILNRSTLEALDLDIDPLLLDFTDEVVEEGGGRR